MQFISFSNPAYMTSSTDFIDVDLIRVEGQPAVRYTAGKNDPESADLYAAIIAAGEIAPYAAPVPTLAEQAAAMLAAGAAVVSTSTPALNATYPCDQTTTSNIQAEVISILLNGTFVDGTSSVAWPDTAGGMHSFTIAEFKLFASGIAGFVGALTKIIQANAGTLPSATVTIA